MTIQFDGDEQEEEQEADLAPDPNESPGQQKPQTNGKR